MVMGFVVGEYPASERQHVRIVMSACQAGGFRCRDRDGADAADLVGGDGHSHSRPADQDAAVGSAGGHSGGNLKREVRVVDRLVRGRSEILVGNVPLVEYPEGDAF